MLNTNIIKMFLELTLLCVQDDFNQRQLSGHHLTHTKTICTCNIMKHEFK